MKKFKVVIEEKLLYKLEIEAENEEQARELAFNHPNFCQNLCDDNDSYVIETKEVEDNE